MFATDKGFTKNKTGLLFKNLELSGSGGGDRNRTPILFNIY